MVCGGALGVVVSYDVLTLAHCRNLALAQGKGA